MVSTNSSLTPVINFFAPLQKLFTHNIRVKTPTLLQMETVECGAAALGIILGYYQLIVPLPELRRECGVSRDGSKASNILKAARAYGFEAKGLKKDINQLKDLRPPYIVFWNFNHFLVVEGIKQNKVYLNDPGTGPRTVSTHEFDEGYTGVTLVMEPGPKFKKGGHKPSLILSLWKRLKTAYAALLYCAMAGLFLTLSGLVIPVFGRVFVDDVLVQGRQEWLRPLLLGMAVTTLFQGILTVLRLRYLRRLKIKLSVGMSSQFLWHILRLPSTFYAQRFAGEISNRVRLNDQVADILSGSLATTVIDTVMVLIYALIMVQYDVVLTSLVVSFAFINVLALQWVSRHRVDANQRLVQEYGKVAGVSIAALQSIETFKASGLESDFFSRWSGYYTKAVNSQQELGVVNQLLSVLPTLLSALSSTLVLAVGGFRVIEGNLSIGMLVAFQGMMQSFEMPVNSLLNFGSRIQQLEADLIRLDDVLCNPIDQQLQQRNHTDINTEITCNLLPKLQGYVDLCNITFGYSRLELPLIENFSLSIKPGQRVALVGGSGSGKSTIAKLVCGLYEPWAGEILFDGCPRRQIPRQFLTNSIAMVEQDILLFSGTVKENLTLWDSTVPDKNLVRACQDAAVHDIVVSMAGGYEGELTEGAANLSGGQRQRLEIARALVNNPSILVMDEATSALDANTERIIDQHMRRRGCTCLVIAHRLSTIRDCDEIIVLERGKVAQRGTHQQLWQAEGLYSQLIRSEGEAL